MEIKEGQKIRNKAGKIVTVLAVVHTVPKCYLVEDEQGNDFLIDVKLPPDPPAPRKSPSNPYFELLFQKTMNDIVLEAAENTMRRLQELKDRQPDAA